MSSAQHLVRQKYLTAHKSPFPFPSHLSITHSITQTLNIITRHVLHPSTYFSPIIKIIFIFYLTCLNSVNYYLYKYHNIYKRFVYIMYIHLQSNYSLIYTNHNDDPFPLGSTSCHTLLLLIFLFMWNFRAKMLKHSVPIIFRRLGDSFREHLWAGVAGQRSAGSRLRWQVGHTLSGCEATQLIIYFVSPCVLG